MFIWVNRPIFVPHMIENSITRTYVLVIANNFIFELIGTSSVLTV